MLCKIGIFFRKELTDIVLLCNIDMLIFLEDPTKEIYFGDRTSLRTGCSTVPAPGVRYNFSSMASKPINIHWIRTGSKPY